MNFRQAVENTNDVKDCYRPGKLAIQGSDKNKVELTDPTQCGGSLFLDNCLANQKKYPQANRWDYVIDYKGKAYFFEIHSANSGEVSTVVAKLEWLKTWLVNQAPHINSLRAPVPFYWVQSNGYHILPNSRHEKLAIQKGIRPISKLNLK